MIYISIIRKPLLGQTIKHKLGPFETSLTCQTNEHKRIYDTRPMNRSKLHNQTNDTANCYQTVLIEKLSSTLILYFALIFEFLSFLDNGNRLYMGLCPWDGLSVFKIFLKNLKTSFRDGNVVEFELGGYGSCLYPRQDI